MPTASGGLPSGLQFKPHIMATDDIGVGKLGVAC